MSLPEMLVNVAGPLTADLLVDAHLQALKAGARLVVVHEGAPTTVALRTAERFEIELRAAAPPELARSDDAMPWGGAPLVEDEPAATFVEPIEMLAFPWVANADPSHDEAELSTPGRERRGFAEHPTLAPNWGLPWPRPGPSTEAVALNDPRIWHSQERIQAVRKDLDKLGAPSFGALKRVD